MTLEMSKGMGREAAGKFLKIVREAYDWNLDDVGNKIGWSGKQLGRWEKGENDAPYIGIRRLLALLNCPLEVFDELFGEGKTEADGIEAAGRFLKGQTKKPTLLEADIQSQIRQIEQTDVGKKVLVEAAQRYLERLG